MLAISLVVRDCSSTAVAMLETFVFTEVLKSWWHRGKSPQVYYYRDKDGKEVDLLFVQDQTLIPMEVKKSASPRRDWAGLFAPLSRLNEPVGPGAVLCLTGQALPLSDSVTAVPVGMI